MSKNTVQKLGAAIVVVASLAYTVYRITSLMDNYSVVNLIAAICEIATLALASTESVLLSSRTTVKARREDENVLLESAKQVLFTEGKTQKQQNAGGTVTKTDVTTQVTGDYTTNPVDVCVFAENANYSELRRCFLSLNIAKDIDNIYVINTSESKERKELIEEFGFISIKSIDQLNAATSDVLVCRGIDILYPDAVKIARTYEFDNSTFLELRSVFSDENALGENGLVEINDKRQQVRESLATRGLATWSTGPSIVSIDAIKGVKAVTTAEKFFRSIERNGVHGSITQEIVSEEISHEKTIAEINWRALDLRYTSRAMFNKYNKKGSKAIGAVIKLWASLLRVSFARQMAAIALTLAFVLDPGRFEFVTTNYLLVGIAVITTVILGGYMSGDSRNIATRIREAYFDIEAVTYNFYKTILSPATIGTDKTIVKKLPTVSFLLVAADAILVYRVFRQHNDSTETLVADLLKNASLFAGYILVVSLLVGLGMVIVKQSRSALRREISRGANLDSEPVSMVDLSPGGAGCISVMAYKELDELTFGSSFPLGEENTKFTCKARVRSCVQWNDSYRVGLEFIDLEREQLDILETYCSIVYPHSQARDLSEVERKNSAKSRINGKVEKRFLSYAASFIALGAIIFSNITTWG